MGGSNDTTDAGFERAESGKLPKLRRPGVGGRMFFVRGASGAGA